MWGGREKRGGRGKRGGRKGKIEKEREVTETSKQRNSNMRPKAPFEPKIFSPPLHFF